MWGNELWVLMAAEDVAKAAMAHDTSIFNGTLIHTVYADQYHQSYRKLECCNCGAPYERLKCSYCGTLS